MSTNLEEAELKGFMFLMDSICEFHYGTRYEKLSKSIRIELLQDLKESEEISISNARIERVFLLISALKLEERISESGLTRPGIEALDALTYYVTKGENIGKLNSDNVFTSFRDFIGAKNNIAKVNSYEKEVPVDVIPKIHGFSKYRGLEVNNQNSKIEIKEISKDLKKVSKEFKGISNHLMLLFDKLSGISVEGKKIVIFAEKLKDDFVSLEAKVNEKVIKAEERALKAEERAREAEKTALKAEKRAKQAQNKARKAEEIVEGLKDKFTHLYLYTRIIGGVVTLFVALEHLPDLIEEFTSMLPDNHDDSNVLGDSKSEEEEDKNTNV